MFSKVSMAQTPALGGAVLQKSGQRGREWIDMESNVEQGSMDSRIQHTIHMHVQASVSFQHIQVLPGKYSQESRPRTGEKSMQIVQSGVQHN